MRVIINNSISLDGYISGQYGEEDWISEADEKYFEEACAEADLILLGRGTYDANQGLYPIPGKLNVVFTQHVNKQQSNDSIVFTNEDPVSYIKKNKDKTILVAGGGKLNATILKSGIVTDIVVCIHPIILGGGGTRQFEDIDHEVQTKLEKISETDIGDEVVKIHYRVINT